MLSVYSRVELFLTKYCAISFLHRRTMANNTGYIYLQSLCTAAWKETEFWLYSSLLPYMTLSRNLNGEIWEGIGLTATVWKFIWCKIYISTLGVTPNSPPGQWSPLAPLYQFRINPCWAVTNASRIIQMTSSFYIYIFKSCLPSLNPSPDHP